MKLKGPEELEQSSVVANSSMNRERELTGTNSYSKDLNLDLLNVLIRQIREHGHVAWLDLCCGTGRALIQAGERLGQEGLAGRFQIVGVDLVSMFYTASPEEGLELLEANLETWEPGRAFDLVTCVHGLHYVGDKLRLIARAVSWLGKKGQFYANLDLANLRLEDGKRCKAVSKQRVAK